MNEFLSYGKQWLDEEDINAVVEEFDPHLYFIGVSFAADISR